MIMPDLHFYSDDNDERLTLMTDAVPFLLTIPGGFGAFFPSGISQELRSEVSYIRALAIWGRRSHLEFCWILI